MQRQRIKFTRTTCALLLLAVATSRAHADLGATGDVSPANPANWTSGTTVYIGNTGVGTVAVDGVSSLRSNNAYLGYLTGAKGSVDVDGTGSSWTLFSNLYVGASGNGTLDIKNGGKVTANSSFSASYIGYDAGSNGTVTVDGPGSLWSAPPTLYVGNSGNGTLAITNGGKVTQSGIQSQGIRIGNAAGSAGVVTVDGPGSTWNLSFDLNVGYSGSGTLAITNGATVAFTSGYNCFLGYNSGSIGVVTVDGPGSQLSMSGGLYVSPFVSGNPSSAGTLIVSNGASVSASFVSIGANVGAIDFGANGGTLTAATITVSPSQITGTGTINTGGLTTDANLIFDATHGLSQSLLWNAPGQNVTVNFNLTAGTNDLGVGNVGSGSLVIKDGRGISSASGSLGYNMGATGTAVIDGSGTTWSLKYGLYVGGNGNGMLALTNGGKLTSQFGHVGRYAGSTGSVSVAGPGSTWTINGRDSGDFSVGGYGTGTLAITSGGKVINTISNPAYVAQYAGSSGTVTVDDIGSTWNAPTVLYVGNAGNGTLAIRRGGKCIAGITYLGYSSSSTGTVVIDGFGSELSVGSVDVGAFGQGFLAIANGGKITASSLSINTSASLVTMSVGDNGLISLSSGTLSNFGTLRLKAAPSAQPAIAYTPIIAGTWSGTGIVQPLGGTWNSSNHTFTPSTIATGTASQPLPIDRSQLQRLRITDPTTSNTLLANFLPSTTSSTLTLTATPLTQNQSDLLQLSLPTTTSFLTGWTFTTTGYTAGTPVYLSLSIGPTFNVNQLALYHFDGTTWTPYTTPDLSYDGTYASFTVTGFSGYAIAAIPEPASAALLALAATPLLVRRRRSQNR